MIEISRSDLSEAAEYLAGIKNGMGKAASRAINHTTLKAKTQMKRYVSKGYYTKQGDVEKTLDLKKATWNNPFSAIISKSPVLPLNKFKVSVGTEGVRAAVSKIEGYKLRKGAFISNVKEFDGAGYSENKSIRIFRRKTRKRLPLQLQYGASIPGMIGNDNVIAALNKFIGREIKIRLSHEVNYLLGRYKKWM